MADMMTFPDTVEEFMEQYKIVDTDQVYTNGVEMVPIFRMKQWFEHLAMVRTQMSVPDCISRQAAIEALGTPRGILYPIRTIEELPSAQPEIIRCKDCGKREVCRQSNCKKMPLPEPWRGEEDETDRR